MKYMARWREAGGSINFALFAATWISLPIPIGDKSMPSDDHVVPASQKMLWAGWIVSALPVLMLACSAAIKFAKPVMLVEELARLGWPESLVLTLGMVELACVVLYAFPRTAVLGAILLTGYLGGATATHVRIGEGFIAPVIFGVLAWLGLYLRDPRIRALIPLRAAST